MTDSPDLKIHPKLKRRIWAVQTKWGLIILVPIFFLMLLFIVDPLDKTKEFEKSGFALMVSMLFGGIILFAFMFRSEFGKYNRANRMIQLTLPRKMKLKGLGISDLDGKFGELWPVSEFSSANTPLWAIVSLHTDSKGDLPRETVTVNLHLDESSPDNYLVVETDDYVFWGKKVTREYVKASWRRFNLTWLATAFVVVCAASWFVYKTDESDFDKIRVVISAIVGLGLFATFVIKEFKQRKKLMSKINGDWT